MRIAAILLTLVTLFPVTGLMAGFFLGVGLFGGVVDLFRPEHREGSLLVIVWSAAGLWGVFAAIEAILHFMQRPEARLDRWQARRVVAGLLAGCSACVAIGLIDLGAFFLALIVTLPLMMLALCLLAMVAVRQA